MTQQNVYKICTLSVSWQNRRRGQWVDRKWRTGKRRSKKEKNSRKKYRTRKYRTTNLRVSEGGKWGAQSYKVKKVKADIALHGNPISELRGAIKSTRSTQPSIPPRQVNRVPACTAGVRRGAFICNAAVTEA